MRSHTLHRDSVGVDFCQIGPPMADQFFIRSSGQIRGPFTRDQILDLRNRSRLQPFHEVSSDRISWAIASSLPEIFPSQAPAPQPTTAPPPEPSYYTEAGGQ